MCKIVVIFALVAVAVQGRLSDDAELWERVGANDASTLDQVVSSAVASANAQLDRTTWTVKKMPDTYSARSKEALLKKAKKIEQDFEKSRQKSVEKNATSCVKGREKQVKALAATYTQKNAQCAKDRLSEGVHIIEMARANIRSAAKIVGEWQSRWRLCKDSQCKKNLEPGIAQAMVDIPAEINRLAAGAASDVNPLVYQVEFCTKRVQNQLDNEGSGILKAIATCIKWNGKKH